MISDLDAFVQQIARREKGRAARRDRPIDNKIGKLINARRAAAELARRSHEGLALYVAFAVVELFHASLNKWRIADGSNRSGKTTAGAVEFCRAICNADPYKKYPSRNGRALVVGKDADHLAMMWRKCWLPGAFQVISDEDTKLLRAVRLDPKNPQKLDAYDDAYRERWRDAPPLIPARLHKNEALIAWEDRKKGIPRNVGTIYGWQTLFRSAEGKPPQGEHYNLGWLDEHIGNEQFYYELVRGLVALHEEPRQRPRGIWTATPQDCNIQLLELREEADAGGERTAAFKLHIEDNPFIPAEEKVAFFDSLSPDERATRYHGQYAIIGRRIYQHAFNAMGLHGYEPQAVPEDACRYVILDPGRQYCGTLLAYIDRDEAHVRIYDGFTLRSADAGRWADEIKSRQGERRFEAFVIDSRMGRQHSPGRGEGDNVAQHYWAKLQAAGVDPIRKGSLAGFFGGSDDVNAREEALLAWMCVRSAGPFAGTPTLQIARGALPDLERQIKHAQYDLKNPNKRLTAPKVEENELVCLEYFAAFNPGYHEPVTVKTAEEDPIMRAWQKRQQRRNRHSSTSIQLGF